MGLVDDEMLERAKCQRFMCSLIMYYVTNNDDNVIGCGKNKMFLQMRVHQILHYEKVV